MSRPRRTAVRVWLLIVLALTLYALAVTIARGTA